ncbi:hypothetical protein ACL2XG_21230 [Sodalis sp. RH24]|uniref:hypothetical protein n=1 Tax=unclassified Sodalis (in: enterobacteria) TaxID=2636512 RepID=UPI0039B38D57
METFLQGLYDRYNIIPHEENILYINEDVVIYFDETDKDIFLLCPCFPVPAQQTQLLELLALNGKSDMSFCAADNLILARLTLRQHDDFDDMMERFSVYIAEITCAIERVDQGPWYQAAGRFA